MCEHANSLRDHFTIATDDEIEDGRAWYPAARRLVNELATAYGTSREIVAGVIAALSQQCRWSTNIDRATTVLDGHNRTGGLTTATEKACMIRDGYDPEETLGPMAYKVRAFYRALLGDDDAAVIDTWMLRAFAWHRAGYTRLQYERLADVLRAEAKRAGMNVVDFQATVWCVIRGGAD